MRTEGDPAKQRLPSWFEGYEQILPESLDDLKGPVDGFIDRSIRPFPHALDNWRMRIELYRELITSGRKVELEQYINRNHFIELWPYIRSCVCDGYRLPWEKKFPELGYRASIDVSIYDPYADEPFRLKDGWMKRSRRLI